MPGTGDVAGASGTPGATRVSDVVADRSVHTGRDAAARDLYGTGEHGLPALGGEGAALSGTAAGVAVAAGLPVANGAAGQRSPRALHGPGPELDFGARPRAGARADAPAAPDRGGPAGGHGTWTVPVASYQLSAGFGSSGSRWSHGHTGQDFAVPVGTRVRSAGEGEVVSMGCGGPFGMSLVVRHPNGMFTQYAHLATVLVTEGERVRTGEPLGLSGNTGNSSGPHLHFEVRRTPEFGSAVDPVRWLGEHGVRLRSTADER
ncbi:peptidoglycan DD-metalloendopeptidase family protein [Streptomyces pactum]|uniref:Peptidoglycan DD-metalloendopeptidase family protein n=1 Tax=Streptomyces pactum TaxID=68249 RepID=A0ABS0NL19_9ACTN|nr:peptidoglycan DD-metalloendopeptidase family protein [Streptomyces pactum]